MLSLPADTSRNPSIPSRNSEERSPWKLGPTLRLCSVSLLLLPKILWPLLHLTYKFNGLSWAGRAKHTAMKDIIARGKCE